MTDIFIRVLLPMSLCGGVFYLLLQPLRPLLARLQAVWRKALLLVCAMLFLLPLTLLGPAVLSPTSASAGEPPLGEALPTAPVYQVGQRLGQAATQPDTAPGEETVLSIDAGAQEGTRKAGLNPLALVTGLYVAGALAMLAWCVVRAGRLHHRLKKASQPVEDKNTLRLYASVCEQLAIARPPVLLQCCQLPSPVLMGAFHSRILLPAEGMDQRQLEFALRHELTHHKKRDLACKYLLVVVSALHWFNPAAHLLRREFADACEQRCDEAVAKQLAPGRRGQYAGVLLDFAAPTQLEMVSAFSGPAKRLNARLRRLMQPVRPGQLAKTAGVALPCLFLAAALLTGCSLAAGAAETDSASLPSSTVPDSSMPQSTPPEESASLPESEVEQPSSLPEEPTASAPAADPATLQEAPTAPDISSLPVSAVGLINPVPDAMYSARGMNEGAHRGFDFNGDTGLPILAAADGEVQAAGWHYSYGFYVEIDHGAGLQTLYAHCDELFVEEGQLVEQGTVIATVGSSGDSTGPHCHFEIRMDDTLVNPEDYIILPEGFKK